MMPDPNSYAAIGWIIVGLAALVTIINQVLRLVDRLRPEKPQPPLERQFADRALIEVELQKNSVQHGELYGQFRRLPEQYLTREEWRAAQVVQADDRREIKSKLDELLQRTAHLVGYGKGSLG